MFEPEHEGLVLWDNYREAEFTLSVLNATLHFYLWLSLIWLSLVAVSFVFMLFA